MKVVGFTVLKNSRLGWDPGLARWLELGRGCARWTKQLWPKGMLDKRLHNCIQFMTRAFSFLFPLGSHKHKRKRKTLHPYNHQTCLRHNKLLCINALASPPDGSQDWEKKPCTKPWYCGREWWRERLQAVESACCGLFGSRFLGTLVSLAFLSGLSL